MILEKLNLPTGRFYPSIFYIWLSLSIFLSGCTLDAWPNRTGQEPAGSGHIAYIGGDGNLYVVDGGLDRHVQLTDDATASIGTLGRSYQRIAWSPENRLAYAAVERLADQTARSQLFIKEIGSGVDLSAEPVLVGESSTNFVIYTYWRPDLERCTALPCDELVYLIEEDEEIVLRHVRPDRDNPASFLNTALGQAWPFYVSWAPDGRSMLWHRNGGRLDPSAASYSIYDFESDRSQPLAIRPGLVIAPAYSPTDPEQFALVNGDNDLILVEGGQQRVIVSGAAGDIAFAWSPNGDGLAYAVRSRLYDPFYQSIWIYDLADRSAERVIDVGLRPVGFFWSPDSTKIGYLQRMEVGNDEWYQWRVVETGSLNDIGFRPFNPTPQMRFVVSSFGQYAQSHRLWSPDSRYLLYYERSRDGGDQIWRIDTTIDPEQDDREPAWVAAGSLAFYTWR